MRFNAAEARKEGVRIAREMPFTLRERVQAAHFIPPLVKCELVREVNEGLKR